MVCNRELACPIFYSRCSVCATLTADYSPLSRTMTGEGTARQNERHRTPGRNETGVHIVKWTKECKSNDGCSISLPAATDPERRLQKEAKH